MPSDNPFSSELQEYTKQMLALSARMKECHRRVTRENMTEIIDEENELVKEWLAISNLYSAAFNRYLEAVRKRRGIIKY